MVARRKLGKVLITGASGKLGSELMKLLSGSLSPSHSEMPVEDRKKVFSYIKRNVPDTVIHLAALVSPPECERNKKAAWDVIVQGTINVIDACKEFSKDCYFILMSTPCVFSGDEEVEKDEDHYPAPDNYYGFCKAIQEMVVRMSGLRWLIVRSNFIPRARYPYPKAFTDRKSYYLFSDVLADAMKGLMDKGITGIAHVVGDRLLSMYDLAKLCPDSGDVGELTLDEYYRQNPNALKLTKSMLLKSNKLGRYKFR